MVQLAYMRCKNKELAEDLVQEAYLKAYQSYLKMGSIEEIKNPRAWLYKILINTYIDYSRKHKLNIVSLDDLDFEDKFEEKLEDKRDRLNEVETRLFLGDLKNALNELDPQQRVVIYLADVNEYSYKEIADLLEIPPGTVMSRLYRARHNLRKILADKGYSRDRVHAGAGS